MKAWISVWRRPTRSSSSGRISGTWERLVKTPKVYFADVATLRDPAGLKDAEHAMAGPMGGAIFETAVVGEMARRLSGRGEQPQLYFWRTSAGVEVDLVVETAGKLIPIEVKSSATPDRSMARNIESFRATPAAMRRKGM